MARTQVVSPRLKADINITPLIDIVLVLLIVFIVLVPGMVKALAAVVPQTTRSPLEGDTRSVVVSLLRDGRLLLQQDEVDRGQLAERLVPVLLRQPYGRRRVVLKVDAEASHGQTVNLMDHLRTIDRQVQTRSLQELGLKGEDLKVVVAVKS